MEMGLIYVVGHGFVLFIALAIVNIPALIINFVVPTLVTKVAIFFVYCFIDGFVAKNVSRFFRERDVDADARTQREIRNFSAKRSARFGVQFVR